MLIKLTRGEGGLSLEVRLKSPEAPKVLRNVMSQVSKDVEGLRESLAEAKESSDLRHHSSMKKLRGLDECAGRMSSKLAALERGYASIEQDIQAQIRREDNLSERLAGVELKVHDIEQTMPEEPSV